MSSTAGGGTSQQAPGSPSGSPAARLGFTAGTVVQEPVLPKWLLKAVLLGGALLLTLFVLWKTVLKPTFESIQK